MNEAGIFSENYKTQIVKQAEQEAKNLITLLQKLINAYQKQWITKGIEYCSAEPIQIVKDKIDLLIKHIDIESARDLISAFYFQSIQDNEQITSEYGLKKFPFYVIYLDQKLADLIVKIDDPALAMAYGWAHLCYYEELDIKPDFIKNYQRLEQLKGKKFPDAILGSIKLADFFYFDELPENVSKSFSPIDSYFQKYLILLNKAKDKNKINEVEYRNNLKYFTDLGCVAVGKRLKSVDNGAGNQSHEKCLQQAVGWLQNAAEMAIHFEFKEELYDVAFKFLCFSASADYYGKNLPIQPAVEWLKIADVPSANAILGEVYLLGKREIQPNPELGLEYFDKSFEQLCSNQQYKIAKELCEKVIEKLSANNLNDNLPLWKERKEKMIAAIPQEASAPSPGVI